MVTKLAKNIFSLVYPNNCESCGRNLISGENIICTNCLYEIPRTNFHKQNENKVEELFWGRIKIEHATALYFFQKGSRFQKIIHKLKYEGIKEIGQEMGAHLGSQLMEAAWWDEIDILIPVPLHPRRQKERGYNQSYWIAKGISDVTEKPISASNLYRSVYTSTQTRKSRYDRWENVEKIFRLKQARKIKNKHILLIDDVITTGSTLEACATVLSRANAKVSVATLAIAV